MHDWEKSLTRVVGKRIVDVVGYVSDEFGDPTFKITGILLEDGTILAVEGEHDFPYIAEDLDLHEDA